MIAPLLILFATILGIALLISIPLAVKDGKPLFLFWAIIISLLVVCIVWPSLSNAYMETYPAEINKTVVTDSCQVVLTDSGNSYNLTKLFKRTFDPAKHTVNVYPYKRWSLGLWWPGNCVKVEVTNGKNVIETVDVENQD